MSGLRPKRLRRFLSWLESKIRQVPVQDVIREKYLNGTRRGLGWGGSQGCKIRTFALLDLAPCAYIEFMISLPERYWVG